MNVLVRCTCKFVFVCFSVLKELLYCCCVYVSDVCFDSVFCCGGVCDWVYNVSVRVEDRDFLVSWRFW